MKIGAKYSHLNGYEWLQYHHPGYWTEIIDTIKAIDAATYRTKISKEKTMLGRKLLNPKQLNLAFKHELTNRGWQPAPNNQYYVTDDEKLTREIIPLGLKEQKKRIEQAGKTPIATSNSADFHKGRVSIEVQLGKYFSVQFDLFIKHAANYMQDRIDLGIEILPMKSMERYCDRGGFFRPCRSS